MNSDLMIIEDDFSHRTNVLGKLGSPQDWRCQRIESRSRASSRIEVVSQYSIWNVIQFFFSKVSATHGDGRLE